MAIYIAQKSRGNALAKNRCPQCGGHLVASIDQPDKKISQCQACHSHITIQRSDANAKHTAPKATVGVRVRDRSNEKLPKPVEKPKTELQPALDTNTLPNINVIQQAMQDKKVISFTYIDAKGNVSSRTVEAYKLTKEKGVIKLYAYCLEKESIRAFNLINIASCVLQPYPFEPRWPVEDLLNKPD